MRLGRLCKVNPREVWPREDRDFTPWLADNIEALGEALGLDLELADSEAAVGSFSLDLLAKDLGTGHFVVIENQFSFTDHDHLGKLLTYAGGYDASTIVWISEFIRDEHRQALDWLNQRTDDSTQFFGVEIEVIKIDDSKPAFKFIPVISPSEWRKSKKKQSSGVVSERGELYAEYFQRLIDILREKHRFTNARKGQPQNWYSFASGIPGFTYGAVFVQKNRVRTEVYIDSGEALRNKAIFDLLFKDRELIENQLGMKLQWERMDERRASRISLYRQGSILSNEDELEEILLWHLEKLLEFKRVFGPVLKRVLKAVK